MMLKWGHNCVFIKTYWCLSSLTKNTAIYSWFKNWLPYIPLFNSLYKIVAAKNVGNDAHIKQCIIYRVTVLVLTKPVTDK